MSDGQEQLQDPNDNLQPHVPNVHPENPFEREVPDIAPPTDDDGGAAAADGDKLAGTDGDKKKAPPLESEEDRSRAFAAFTRQKREIQEQKERLAQEKRELEQWREEQAIRRKRIAEGDLDAILKEATGEDFNGLTKRYLAQKKAPGVIPPELEERLSKVDQLEQELQERKKAEEQQRKQTEEQQRAAALAGKLDEYLETSENKAIAHFAKSRDGFGDAVRQLLENTHEDDDWTVSDVERAADQVVNHLRTQYDFYRKKLEAAGALNPDGQREPGPNPERLQEPGSNPGTARTGETSEGTHQLQPLRQDGAAEARGHRRGDRPIDRDDRAFDDWMFRSLGRETMSR